MAQKSSDSRTLIIVAFITGIFGIITACITGFFALKASQSKQDTLATNTALVQQVDSGNSTQASLVQTVDAPVYTQIPLPTYTPFPTIAPTATLIPSSPTPTIQLPFSDNFDNGINPVWKTITGTWRTVNDQLIADPSNNYATIQVGDKGWTDYVIDVDVFKPGYTNAGYPIGVIVRANNGNYLLYQWNCCSTDWILVNGASKSVIAHLDQGINTYNGGGTSKLHMHIEVNGQNYTGSVDEKLYLTVSDPTIINGSVGLTVYYPNDDTFRFDDFKITLP